MENKPTIVITLCRRPDYTHRMLEALSQCYGIDDYDLLFSVDFDERHERESWDTYGLAVDFRTFYRHPACEVYHHKPRLGIDRNKMWAIPRAFEYTDFVIALEDDTIPAMDFLRYMEWAREAFRADPQCMAVSGYSNPTTETPEDFLYQAFRREGFNTWGWGMWQNRWRKLFGDGSRYVAYAGDLVDGLFDRYFRDLSHAKAYDIVQPAVARVQNVGELNGEHTIPEQFMRTDYNRIGAWLMPNLPDPQPNVWSLCHAA